MQRRTVFGSGIDEPLVTYEPGGVRRFLHADERGSIVAASDAAGNLAAGYSYDEFGTPAATNGGRFQYTGQMWLHEIGVQYSKARMYAPHLGRFLQPDPIRYAAGPNLYAYVGNDPVNFTDPLGLDGDETECPENQHRCPPAIIVTGSQPSGGGGAPTTNAANAALLTAGVSPVPAPSGPDITVIGRRGHSYKNTERICTPQLGRPCHIERSNTEACILPGHISTDPIESGSLYAVYGTYADIFPSGIVRTTQTGFFSFRNTTTLAHPLSGTVDRIFFSDHRGNVYVTTIGSGTAFTALQDNVNQIRGPGIFQQQNEICGAIIGGQ